MACYERPDFTRLRYWDFTIPRFLFRGFNQYSGDNKELNTPTAITPHAFLVKSVDIKHGKPVRCGEHNISAPSHKSHFSGPTALNAMSLEHFRSDINGHLYGSKGIVSHFSSWTADFQIALRYTWGGHGPPNSLDRHIGILDTSHRNYRNAILHVGALRQERHTGFDYDYEYLVYGPVTGIPYTCLTLPWRQNSPVCPPSCPPLYADWSNWPLILGFNPLSEIRKAYNRAARHSFYQAADTGREARWGSCTDTALFLTIVAAEWSRNFQRDLAEYRIFSNPPDLERWQQLRVSDLSRVMEWAARDATLVLPLVNLHIHTADSEELAMMLRLLAKFEAEIIKIRSEPPPEPWSLTRFLWG